MIGSSARTKGVSYVHARMFVEHRFGADGWAAVLARLPLRDREEVESVIPVGWYDLGVYARLIRAVDEVHGTGDLALLSQVGRFQAERDFTTIQRMFFRLANPAFAVEKTADYWRRFHDSGTWNVQRVSDAEVTGELRDWGVVDRALCRELTAYMGRVLELVGAKHVIMEHTRCRALGDAQCSYRARWASSKRAPSIAPAPLPPEPVARSGSGVMSTLVSAPNTAANEGKRG